MNKLLSILLLLGFLFSSGCSDEAKKNAPGSPASSPNQSQDEHISGDATSSDHLSGAESSDTHVSGNNID